MIDSTDCQKCKGTGLVKFFWLRQWMAGQCDLCKGFGVDPSALRGIGDGELESRGYGDEARSENEDRKRG